ncbi:hypothetical protein DICA3_C18866 [Diutina catenulata]
MTLSFKRNTYLEHPHKLKSKTNTTHVIPTLDELLEDDSSSGFYSKGQFIEYLQSVHCVENLTFVIAINSYLANPSIAKWRVLWREFFTEYSDSEINLPSHCKKMVSDKQEPNIDVLVRFKRIIYDDILLDLYNEFIKSQKLKLQRQNPGASFKRKEVLMTTTAPVSMLSQPSTECPLDCDTDHECFSPKSMPSSRGSSIGSLVDSFKVDLKKFRIRRFSNEKELAEVVES